MSGDPNPNDPRGGELLWCILIPLMLLALAMLLMLLPEPTL